LGLKLVVFLLVDSHLILPVVVAVVVVACGGEICQSIQTRSDEGNGLKRLNAANVENDLNSTVAAVAAVAVAAVKRTRAETKMFDADAGFGGCGDVLSGAKQTSCLQTKTKRGRGRMLGEEITRMKTRMKTKKRMDCLQNATKELDDDGVGVGVDVDVDGDVAVAVAGNDENDDGVVPAVDDDDDDDVVPAVDDDVGDPMKKETMMKTRKRKKTRKNEAKEGKEMSGTKCLNRTWELLG